MNEEQREKWHINECLARRRIDQVRYSVEKDSGKGKKEWSNRDRMETDEQGGRAPWRIKTVNERKGDKERKKPRERRRKRGCKRENKRRRQNQARCDMQQEYDTRTKRWASRLVTSTAHPNTTFQYL